MMAELNQNGPISCGIEASAPFEQNYNGGIWRQYIKDPELNHEIAVVGYGTDSETGEKYWIGRNSWGTFWGEFGFFKVPHGPASINMGIQTDCVAGMPDYEQHP